MRKSLPVLILSLLAAVALVAAEAQDVLVKELPLPKFAPDWSAEQVAAMRAACEPILAQRDCQLLCVNGLHFRLAPCLQKRS